MSIKDEQGLKYEKLTWLTEGDYRAFLYDCDGTLADNMQAHKNAYIKAASHYSINLDPNLIDELAGWQTVAVAKEISQRYNVALDPIAFATLKSDLYIDEHIMQTVPNDFVVRHLIKNAAIKKIGVVTSGSRRTVQKTLDVLGIRMLADVIICAGETLRPKPYADPYLSAAEILGVNPKLCLAFEDSDAGEQSAIGAGMECIRVDKL